jgi:signal recognition particle subunit SRP54
MSLSRKKRIARGCGQDMENINRFIKQFDQMSKMMYQMSKNPAMAGMGGNFKGGRRR